ncbi:MAG: hypothetical protein ACREDK_08075 [Thermoplasmata archaeon]
MPTPIDPRDLEERLRTLSERGAALESEGLPFPTEQIVGSVRRALDLGDTEQATQVLRRGESLYAKASRDWTWVRELLRRADELRALAQSIGVDIQHLDLRVGNARDQLKAAALSGGSLEKAAASASLALAVLSDAIPKFCVQEAQRLGVSIRSARDRGEDVSTATLAFSELLESIKDEHLPLVTSRLLDTRRAVARIPIAPAVATLPSEEEEEILLEARNLARRLQRIKSRARDAHSAAKLMTQVRAALSEDRRFGTPEEEIEALWNEVDRLAKERQSAEVDPRAGTITPAPHEREDHGRPGERGRLTPTLVPPEEMDGPTSAFESPVEARRHGRGARSTRP